MKFGAVIGVLIIGAILLTGCITSNKFYEVTIIEKYPAKGIYDLNLVKISEGDILAVESFTTYQELEIGHTYIVKVGTIHPATISETVGIVGIDREANNT